MQARPPLSEPWHSLCRFRSVGPPANERDTIHYCITQVGFASECFSSSEELAVQTNNLVSCGAGSLWLHVYLLPSSAIRIGRVLFMAGFHLGLTSRRSTQDVVYAK